MNNEIFDLPKFSKDIFDDFSKTEIQEKTEKKKKIPVIMISGFLGSGKTTLLNHLLKSSPNLKIGAIVNDFGKINIDSQLISGNLKEQKIELSNGCICCMIGDNGLSEPLKKLANKNSKLDAIIIEASGIAEPHDFLKTLRYTGNQYSYFGGNIYIIDARNFEKSNQDFPTHFKKCLKSSDIIVLNKTDLVSKNQIQRIRKFIRELNPQSPIIESQNSQIDPKLVFSWEENSKDKQPKIEENHSHDHNNHIHNRFNSLSFETKKALNPTNFINFLDHLPENLFRMKGICYFGMKGYEQKFIVQIVGKTVEILAEEWKNQEPKTELVLIGTDLNQDEIYKNLNAIIDKNPEDITPENMMNFERFFLTNQIKTDR